MGRGVAHGLDVVAVGIADEGSVVVLVIFGKHPWRVEDLGADGDRSFVEGVDGIAVGGAEGDVELAVLIPFGG